MYELGSEVLVMCSVTWPVASSNMCVHLSVEQLPTSRPTSLHRNHNVLQHLSQPLSTIDVKLLWPSTPISNRNTNIIELQRRLILTRVSSHLPRYDTDRSAHHCRVGTHVTCTAALGLSIQEFATLIEVRAISVVDVLP